MDWYLSEILIRLRYPLLANQDLSWIRDVYLLGCAEAYMAAKLSYQEQIQILNGAPGDDHPPALMIPQKTAYSPTHVLRIYSTLEREAGMIKYLPVHDIILLLYCSGPPRLPRSNLIRNGLPVVSVCVYSVEMMPTLIDYLTSRRPEFLYAHNQAALRALHTNALMLGVQDPVFYTIINLVCQLRLLEDNRRRGGSQAIANLTNFLHQL